MKRGLLGLGVPAVVVGAVVGAGWWASKMDLIPPVVWHYLWPGLVAFGFLVLSVGALLIGAYRWLWPLGTGFLVQTTGLLLLWGDVFDSPWEPLIYTAVAVGAVILVMLIVWLIATMRARWLERKMIDGVSGVGDVDQQKIAEIRRNMLEALSLLKRAGLGRNAIYELPWFLVIGRSQAGKTVAIKNSGLGLPVKKDRVKGVGGTHTCDWFFTNDLVFLDTPGAWVTEGAGEEGNEKWIELLRLLRKYRGRRPLDGLVVVVPADDLLSKSDQELEEQAANIRQVVDTLHDELRFRFPVYLVVSKSDLVEGFVDFFRGLPAQRRSEIVGWSHPDPSRGDPARLIPRGFQRVVQRLQAYRLDMLARIASVTRARRLFFFTEEFKNLERPLQVMAGVLFESDPYHERPVFRGFYFTSGTQGEGAPLGQAMAQLAKTLGVRVGQAAEAAEEEPKRSYFLLDLFRELMLGDHGLVSRTAVHWWRMRRDTMFVVFLPAVLAVFLFGLSCCSFMLNSRTYGRIGGDVPQIVKTLDDFPYPLTGQRVLEALDMTGHIRDYHRQLTGFNPLRGFGMRRTGDLPEQTFEVFRQQLNRAILKPTLRNAEAFATNPENSCTDRIDVFYSVIYLRRGHRGEWSGDLKGLEKVWNLSPEQAAEARKKLLQQFAYLTVHGPGRASLLPGISLAKVAGSIAEECRTRGPGSALDQYQKFQEECARPATNSETTRCRDKLLRVLKSPKEDYARLRRYLDGLKGDLADLKYAEPEAEAALQKIESIPLQQPTISECLGQFNDKIIPAVERYMDQKTLIDDCNSQWKMAGKDRLKAMEVVQEQEKARADKKKELFSMMEGYREQCADMLPEGFSIDVNALSQFGYELRLISCIEERGYDIEPAPRPQPAAAPARAAAAPAPAPPPAVERALSLFSARSRQPRGYSLREWDGKKQKWGEDLRFAEQRSPAQRERAVGLVRDSVEQYARDYAAAWRRYLEGLEVRGRRGSVPGWLATLAGTPEYASLLRPAAQAIPEVPTGEPPFDALARGMESLRPLAPFVNSHLAEYQSLLGQVGKDLEQCEKSSGFWTRYRSQVAARDATNNLVKAFEWVDRNAAAGLAEGRLRDMFLGPLKEAEEYVQSSDLTLKQWGDLAALYKSVATRFPFTSDEAAHLVDVKDFVALLGGKSGVVPVLQAASREQTISAAARAWLERAAPLSDIFFEAGEDELKPYRVKLAIEAIKFDPPDLEKDFQIDAITVYLGEGVRFEWKDPEPRIRTLSVPLFGDDASTYSFFAAMVAERKGTLGRAFGKNFKETERLDAARAEGPWSPVRLLMQGLPADADAPSGNTLNLAYAVEVPYKKDQPGHLKFMLRVEGKGLAALIRLLRNGLPAPPASIAAE